MKMNYNFELNPIDQVMRLLTSAINSQSHAPKLLVISHDIKKHIFKYLSGPNAHHTASATYFFNGSVLGLEVVEDYEPKRFEVV